MTEHSDPMHVLIVDHDPIVRDAVARYLDEHDLRVAVASDRHAAMPKLDSVQLSMVILDLHTGKENGLDLLREIHSRRNIAVITTGHGCSEMDRVVALELGADDYIPKPLSLRELLARIRGIVRRRESSRAGPQQCSQQGCYLFGGWRLHRGTRQLLDPNGERVPLTKGEYTLLTTFLNAPLRSLTREHLLQATRIHEDIFDRSIDVQVLRLRRKLEVNPSAPRMIRTERGIGYRFELPVEDAGATRNGVGDRVDPEACFLTPEVPCVTRSPERRFAAARSGTP